MRRRKAIDMENTADGARSALSAGLGDEALKILAELVESIEIKAGERERYNFERYARHTPGCKRPRGDQCCECGYSQTRFNLDCLLDECEGYQNQAPIDMARNLLLRAGLLSPNLEGNRPR